MLDCWSERPECRPTFRLCLEVIQMLQRSYADVHKNIPWSERNANIGKLDSNFRGHSKILYITEMLNH